MIRLLPLVLCLFAPALAAPTACVRHSLVGRISNPSLSGTGCQSLLRRQWRPTTPYQQSPENVFEQFLSRFGPAEGTTKKGAVEPDAVERVARTVFETPEFRALPRLDLKEGAEVDSPEPARRPERRPLPRKETDFASPLAGLAQFLRSLFGSASLVLIVVLVVFIAVGIAAAILYVGKTWRQQETGPIDDDATDDPEADRQDSPGDRPPDVWLEVARRAAANGRFDEAVSCLLLGAMGHAERAGLIQPRRGLTYRDYLRVVPRASAWHPALDRLIRAYAPIGFGRRPGTAQTFAEVLGPYEAALNAQSSSGGEER